MNRTIRILSLFVAILALVACAETGGGDNPCGDNPCGDNPCNPCGDNPCNPCGTGGVDMGQMMLDQMKSQPTMYMMALPPEAAVGQWWEMSMSGMNRTYTICGEHNGNLIVESTMDVGGTTLVEAWEIDASVDLQAIPEEGEPMANNVVMAWIGLPEQAPNERPIMDVPVMPATDGNPCGTAEYETGEETIELGGRSWDATWTEAGGAKTWMATGTNFILKSEAGGNVSMELVGWGDEGAEPKMDWSDVLGGE